MKKAGSTLLFLLLSHYCFCWGFYAHRKINFYAIFLLPPELMVLYKPNAEFLSEHAVDPDKRRYALPAEAPRHYFDWDFYDRLTSGAPVTKWNEAVEKYSEDSLQAHGILPWWVQTMLTRLTRAFREKNQAAILKLSADIGHYIADAHVPLHANSNYNGQFTGQQGIHGLWESRIPELLADNNWDFFIGKAGYLKNPGDYIWKTIKESARASDTVLKFEKELNNAYSPDRKFAFEERNGMTTRQYSSFYSKSYHNRLNGMVERRMRQSVFAIASFWYTAWVNAGQPDLTRLSNREFSDSDLKEFETLNQAWKNGAGNGREHE